MRPSLRLSSWVPVGYVRTLPGNRPDKRSATGKTAPNALQILRNQCYNFVF
jgi:hypothetical protein